MAINPKPSFPKIVDRSIRRKGARVPSNVFPASPIHGDLFYETDTDILWGYDGSNWVQLVASGGWADFTPVLTNVSLGNGTLFSRFTRNGRQITYSFQLVIGSTTSITGVILFSVPVLARSSPFIDTGVALALDSGTTYRVLGVRTASSVIAFQSDGVGDSNVDATNPFTWANGDRLHGTITYEAAASV